MNSVLNTAKQVESSVDSPCGWHGALVVRARSGDKNASRELVQRHKRHIELTAWKYYLRYGFMYSTIDDMKQDGMIGLLTAVQECESESQSIAYFQEYIRGAILEGLRVMNPVSRNVAHARKTIEDARNIFTRVHLRSPSSHELREQIPAWCHHQLGYEGPGHVSVATLNEGGDENEVDIVTLLRCDESLSPESRFFVKKQNDAISALYQELVNMLTVLDERERRVFLLRFDQTREKPLTLKEIGEQLSLSEGRVCQICADLRDKLQRRLRKTSLANVELFLSA